MMRITIHLTATGVSVQVEGRLAGTEAVAEVHQCLTRVRAEHSSLPVCMDLQAVTFLDCEGKRLLQQEFQHGVSFLFSGCLMRSYIEEITRTDLAQTGEMTAERRMRWSK